MPKTSTILFGIAAAAAGWFFFQKYDLRGLEGIQLAPEGQSASQTNAPNDPFAPPPVRSTGTIRVASFNIQVFGRSKAAKPHVMDLLARIVRSFDLVAIQQIQCSNDDLLPNFVELINAADRHYDYVIGPRLGRTSNKEQYAYIFDLTTIEVDRSQLYTVADPDDLLCREPLVGWFRVRGPPPDQAFTFSLVNVRTDQEQTEQELNVLDDVYRVVRDDGRREDDVIVLGDLNVGRQASGPIGPDLRHGVGHFRNSDQHPGHRSERQHRVSASSHERIHGASRRLRLHAAIQLVDGRSPGSVRPHAGVGRIQRVRGRSTGTHRVAA